MKTTTTTRLLFSALCLLIISALQSFSPSVLSASASGAGPFFDGANDPDSLAVMQQAEADIEKYRKSDITLQLTDEHGNPIPGSPLATINLVRHQFNFGCSMFGMSRLPDYNPIKKAGLQAILDLFNQVVVVDHWHNPFGEIEDKHPAKDIAWAEANNMRMRYHAILYEEPREALEKKFTQDEYWQLFEQRFQQVAAITAGKPLTYDVINEVVARKHWFKNNPKSFYRMVPDYPDLSQPGLVVRAYALARKYFGPDAKLTALENGNPRPDDKLYNDIIPVWKAALDAGADIDYIGTQCHFFDDGQSFRPEERQRNKNAFTMAVISKALDMQKVLNKPIEVTEFTGPSRNKLKTAEQNKKLWTMSEAENSAWQINFYKLVFSKPYIIGLTRWNLIDSYCGRAADGGILTMEGEKHQIYHDLKKLLKETWHTRLVLPLDKTATLSFRGYHGDYQLTIPGYAPATFTLHPDPQTLKLVLKKQ